MKKSILSLAVIAASAVTAFAQPSWSKHYSGEWHEYQTSSVLDNDNNVYVSGSFSKNATLSDNQTNAAEGFFVAKYNPSGTLLWMKKGRGKIATTTQMTAMDYNNGNLYVAGTFKDTLFYGSFSAIASSQAYMHNEICLMKLDPATGEVLNHRRLHGGSDSYVAANAIKSDNEGNVYMTGLFNYQINLGTGHELSCWSGLYGELFVARFNSALETQWTYKPSSESKTFGSRLVLDNQGDVIISGIFHKGINFGPGNVFVAKGTSGNPSDRQNAFVAKLNKSNGSLTWVKPIYGNIPYNLTDISNALATDQSGAIYAVVNYNTFIITESDSTSTNMDQQVALIKYNASGNREWIKHIGGTSTDVSSALAVNHSGNILLGGLLSGNVTIDGITDFYSGTGSKVMFIAQFTPAGNAVSIQKIADGGSNFAGISTLTPGKTDNRYLAGGYFVGTLDATPLPQINNGSVAVSYQDAFVIMMNGTQGPVGIDELNGEAFSVYPNPTNGWIKAKQENVTMSIIELNGKVMHSSETNQINIDFLPNGIYLVKIVSGEDVFIQRIVKE